LAIEAPLKSNPPALFSVFPPVPGDMCELLEHRRDRLRLTR
jgi:hypothetical protein